MSGTGDGDEVTERFDADPDAITEVDRTVRLGSRDDSAGYTVPHAQGTPTELLQPPPQFVRPPQFVPPPQFDPPPQFVPPPEFDPAPTQFVPPDPAPTQFVPPPQPQFVPPPQPQFVPPPQPQFRQPPQFPSPPPQFPSPPLRSRQPALGLPQRIPGQFDPFAGSGSSAAERLDQHAPAIRIGSGVVVPIPPSRSRDGGPASRRWWGYATRVLSGIVTLAIIGVAVWTGWQWWQHMHDQVAVGNVSVAPAQLFDGTCDVQYDIVGTITTNGKAGTIAYEWLRSDGQQSGTLKQSVTAGQTSTTVHLYWKFTGKGSMTATATLRVLDPTQIDGAAQFLYSCH
jgi:hypothetical protein